MRIALYGKSFSDDAVPYVNRLQYKLKEHGAEVSIYHNLNMFFKDHCEPVLEYSEFRGHYDLIEFNPEILITLGGDGTILDAVTLVQNSQIPILGINTGRLGFLSNVGKEEIDTAIEAIFAKNYSLDPRNVLESPSMLSNMELNFALNEVTVSRKDTTAMVTVHVWINGELLNSYWADGLIIATPTGSTGYSLSCGGPIIMPGSQNFVITPIAPHNLNVRPFVIPNNVAIRLQVETREKQFLVSMDSRIYSLDNGKSIDLKLAGFKVNLVRTEIQNFPQTLRNKLLWGVDKRN